MGIIREWVPAPNSHEENELETMELSGYLMGFYHMLGECLLRGMKDILGEGGARAVFFHLELALCGDDPKQIHRRLYSVFSDGAVTLERMIVKELFQSMNMAYVEGNEFSFERYVEIARQLMGTKLGGTELNE